MEPIFYWTPPLVLPYTANGLSTFCLLPMPLGQALWGLLLHCTGSLLTNTIIVHFPVDICTSKPHTAADNEGIVSNALWSAYNTQLTPAGDSQGSIATHSSGFLTKVDSFSLTQCTQIDLWQYDLWQRRIGKIGTWFWSGSLEAVPFLYSLLRKTFKLCSSQ